MDVRCERCKTEYEFDDARVTEAGVTVKCTTCGHVFRVRKKAFGVTEPVKPTAPDAAAAPLAPSAAPTPPSPAPPPADEQLPPPTSKEREWKVRQPNGNVFTFKELTTLQKWIVERKVSRDDEISLTGQNWKRLGNIAELASFFQVVDEAQKAAQLAALTHSGIWAGGVPVPSPAMPPVAAPTQPLQLTAPAPPLPAAMPASVRPEPPSPAPTESTELPGSTPIDLSKPARPAVKPLSRAVRSAERRPDDDDDELVRAIRPRRFSRVVAVLMLLAAVGALGYYAYFDLGLKERLFPSAAKVAAVDAGAAPEVIDAGLAAAPPIEAVDAGEADAGAVAQAVVDAGAEPPKPEPKPEPERDFDYYQALGDRLRERERAQAALEAYRKAAELAPDRAEPIAGRGLALLDLGRAGQAQFAFEEALRLNPRYGVAIIGLAEAFRAMDKKDQAIRYYQRYLEALPSGPDAHVAKTAIEQLKKR